MSKLPPQQQQQLLQLPSQQPSSFSTDVLSEVEEEDCPDETTEGHVIPRTLSRRAQTTTTTSTGPIASTPSNPTPGSVSKLDVLAAPALGATDASRQPSSPNLTVLSTLATPQQLQRTGQARSFNEINSSRSRTSTPVFDHSQHQSSTIAVPNPGQITATGGGSAQYLSLQRANSGTAYEGNRSHNSLITRATTVSVSSPADGAMNRNNSYHLFGAAAGFTISPNASRSRLMKEEAAFNSLQNQSRTSSPRSSAVIGVTASPPASSMGSPLTTRTSRSRTVSEAPAPPSQTAQGAAKDPPSGEGKVRLDYGSRSLTSRLGLGYPEGGTVHAKDAPAMPPISHINRSNTAVSPATATASVPAAAAPQPPMPSPATAHLLGGVLAATSPLPALSPSILPSPSTAPSPNAGTSPSPSGANPTTNANLLSVNGGGAHVSLASERASVNRTQQRQLSFSEGVKPPVAAVPQGRGTDSPLVVAGRLGSPTASGILPPTSPGQPSPLSLNKDLSFNQWSGPVMSRRLSGIAPPLRQRMYDRAADVSASAYMDDHAAHAGPLASNPLGSSQVGTSSGDFGIYQNGSIKRTGSNKVRRASGRRESLLASGIKKLSSRHGSVTVQDGGAQLERGGSHFRSANLAEGDEEAAMYASGPVGATSNEQRPGLGQVPAAEKAPGLEKSTMSLKTTSGTGPSGASGLTKANSSGIFSQLPPVLGTSHQDEEIMAELYSLTDPRTLTFLDPTTEESYLSYFSVTYLPMWRVFLIVELVFAAAQFFYHMSTYPSQAKAFQTLTLQRLDAFPDASTWDSISCIAGYTCETCIVGQLCNAFDSAKETVFFVIGYLVPALFLYAGSFWVTPTAKINPHAVSVTYLIYLCCLTSGHHALIQPTVPHVAELVSFLVILYGGNILMRIRFLYVAIASPLVILVYIAECLATRGSNNNDVELIGMGSFVLAVTLATICLGARDHETSTRAQFLKSRKYMDTTAQLMERLQDMGKTFSEQIADFDSPLEKAIGLVKMLRADTTLDKRHMEITGVLLGLLNSADIMAPDISRQIEGGKMALDEEAEAWLLANLYRGRKRNSKTTTHSFGMRRRSELGEIGSGPPSIFGPRGVSFSAPSAPSSADISSQKSNLSLSPAPSSRKRSAYEDDISRHQNSRRESYAAPTSQARKESVASQAVSEIQQHIFQQQATITISVAAADDGPVVENGQLTQRRLNSTRSTPQLVRTHTGASNAGAAMATATSLGIGHGHQAPTVAAVSTPGNGLLAPGNEISAPSPTGSEEWDSITELNSQLQMVSLLEKVDHWNWEVFDLVEVSHHRPLLTLSHYLFLKADFYNRFGIPNDLFLNFMTRIEAGYRADVPYHNSVHATDVLHGTSWLKDRCMEMINPSDLEVLALFLAAIIHDYDHPGRNNNFLINTSDPKALLYNDRSVLENHHVSSAFKVLLSTECNFLVNLPREDYKQIRELTIELVLATDLQTEHFTILSMFKNKVSNARTFDPDNMHEDKLLLFKMIIKCADVSNPTKTWALYSQWTERVLKEFFLQGDAEKQHGLPVSPYYDRETIFVPASQLGFIDFICVPLFEAFDLYATLPCALEGLYENRNQWLRARDEAHARLQNTASVAALVVPDPPRPPTPPPAGGSAQSAGSVLSNGIEGAGFQITVAEDPQ